jgi:hypothetical protein
MGRLDPVRSAEKLDSPLSLPRPIWVNAIMLAEAPVRHHRV